MRNININIKIKIIILSLTAFLMIISFSNINYADSNIRLVVNGKDITELSSPVLENNRTLVPIRFVSESLGAKVYWNNENRTVEIVKGEKQLFLKIDSRLVSYNNGAQYQLSDVAPKIINNRTFVPVRLVSNALGVGIDWVDKTRTVVVTSDKSSEIVPFYNVKIKNILNKGTITGKTNIKLDIPDKYINDKNIAKLLLIDKERSSGFIVARSQVNDLNLEYIPKISENGKKILVVGIYDKNNKFIAGESKEININVKPEISILGINNNDIISNKLTIVPEVNFIANYITYEIENLETKNVKTISKRDPFGSYTWYPENHENGVYRISIKAYDKELNEYISDSKVLTVNVEKSLKLGGAYNGLTINIYTDLYAKRNFAVNETSFLMKDVETGKTEIIKTIPYGSYKWYPKVEDKGLKDLSVKVLDSHNNEIESESVRVTIDPSPVIYLQGVGPNQILTDSVNLSVLSNVDIKEVKYIVINSEKRKVGFFESENQDNSYIFTPTSEYDGNIKIVAVGKYNGKTIESEFIELNVYTDTTYSSKNIVEKSEFMPLVSEMAINSYKKTDMSAALQAAQAILETGWGQSLPVDKYTNKFSNNLFGIKGSSSNGSVICNTWEVYNGVTYRVDAAFRAYNSVEESWADHKALLLNKSWYKVFRDVMYDSSLGAWAIRRAGYATDPKYPTKLMNIIEEYNLKELDRIDI